MKHYSFHIWAIGKWSEHYDEENLNEITFFGFHFNHIDKIRPSSAYIKEESKLEYIDSFIRDIKYILEGGQFGIEEGYVVLGLKEVPFAEPLSVIIEREKSIQIVGCGRL